MVTQMAIGTVMQSILKPVATRGCECMFGRLAAWAVALAMVLLPAELQAQSTDRIKTVSGTVTSGKVIAMTPEKVVLKKGVIGQTDIDVAKIDSIAFAGEPKELAQARTHLANKRLQDAQAALAKIDAAKITRAEIRQEVDYFKALCAARLALAGQAPLDDAGKLMYRFVAASGQSFHYFTACEILGDLLLERGNFAQAETYYQKVAAAPWPEVQTRAHLGVARALLAQGQADAARKQLDAISQSPAASADARRQQTMALILKAACQTETGKVTDGVESLVDIIAKTDPEDGQLQAQAYNALGNCYLKMGKERAKDALLAFLHVDVLYNTVPASHAEALAKLVPLWEAIGKPDRAREARKLLRERYPNSRWAR